MISKWVLDGRETTISLPLGSKFLCVGESNSQLCVWTDDRLTSPPKPRTRYFEHFIYLVPTGDHAPEGGVYIGSIERYYVMWHVYVVTGHGYVDGLMQQYANNALVSKEALLRDQEGVYS